MPTKMAIIWRHDLNCRLGKKMGQAGHGVIGHLRTYILNNIDPEGNVSFKLTPAEVGWLMENERKVVLRVENEAELLLLHQRAKELGVKAELIEDLGLTEFKEPTKTVLALGPDYDERIDEITGEKGPLGRLKLL